MVHPAPVKFEVLTPGPVSAPAIVFSESVATCVAVSPVCGLPTSVVVPTAGTAPPVDEQEGSSFPLIVKGWEFDGLKVGFGPAMVKAAGTGGTVIRAISYCNMRRAPLGVIAREVTVYTGCALAFEQLFAVTAAGGGGGANIPEQAPPFPLLPPVVPLPEELLPVELVPVLEVPVVEVPVVELPVVDDPVVELPVVELPVVDDPVVELPVVEPPVVDDPVVEVPVVELPVVDDPVVELPVVELPVVDDPVVEVPVVELPVVDDPVVELPVVELPVVDDPVVELPVVELPVVEPEVVELPVVEL